MELYKNATRSTLQAKLDRERETGVREVYQCDSNGPMSEMTDARPIFPTRQRKLSTFEADLLLAWQMH